jgi:RNA polymerase sigma factor (TIGR02999 family)
VSFHSNTPENKVSGQAPGNTGKDLSKTVYRELRKVAAARMANEQAPQTLQATALVHEAWLRVGGDQQPEWASRRQFFSAAAEAMRRILVDRARRRQAIRHGSGQVRVDMDAAEEEFPDRIEVESGDATLIALHEALETLAEGDESTANLVKLRYFAGMSVEEAALALDISKRTAERRLSFARSWLQRAMKTSKERELG